MNPVTKKSGVNASRDWPGLKKCLNKKTKCPSSCLSWKEKDWKISHEEWSVEHDMTFVIQQFHWENEYPIPIFVSMTRLRTGNFWSFKREVVYVMSIFRSLQEKNRRMSVIYHSINHSLGKRRGRRRNKEGMKIPNEWYGCRIELEKRDSCTESEILAESSLNHIMNLCFAWSTTIYKQQWINPWFRM